MTWLEVFEFLSYAVTVVGLPFAIAVFMHDRGRARMNDQEEIYQRLADEYANFLKLVLDNADLRLLRRTSRSEKLDEQQEERRFALFNILVSLFERAYMLVYEQRMDRQTRRLWLSWEDYMREWCGRADFRAVLPELLEGEDADFREHIERICAEESRAENSTQKLTGGSSDAS
jgi:hypothetical protein